VITRNQPAYEQLCQKILATFPTTTNPYVGERMAKDCLLLPHSGVDLLHVDKLADAAVNLPTGEPSNPFFQTAKAISSYRLGRYREAIEWAEKPLNKSEVHASAHACAILAMAHWQLGRKSEAQAMLAKGKMLAPQIIPGSDEEEIGGAWVAWLFAQIALDEASVLIQPGAPVEDTSKP